MPVSWVRRRGCEILECCWNVELRTCEMEGVPPGHGSEGNETLGRRWSGETVLVCLMVDPNEYILAISA